MHGLWCFMSFARVMVSYERVGVQKVKLFSATDCGEVGEDEDWDEDWEMSVNK